MSKITLIGIDTAKNVFHLVGIDKRGNYTYRKQVSRQQLLPALAKLEACVVVLVWDVLEELDQLQQRLDEYTHRIEQRVRNDATSQRLRDELLGVGPLGASALRVKVADVRDFVNGRNFAAYLGMAPGHRGTGGKVKIGKIRSGHDRYLRQLLIHGARAVVQHLGDKQDPQSRWLRGVLERRAHSIRAGELSFPI